MNLTTALIATLRLAALSEAYDYAGDTLDRHCRGEWETVARLNLWVCTIGIELATLINGKAAQHDIAEFQRRIAHYGIA